MRTTDMTDGAFALATRIRTAGDDLARAAAEIVDSFTDPKGGFIHDDLTRVEYESLKAALGRYRVAVVDDSDRGS